MPDVRLIDANATKEKLGFAIEPFIGSAADEIMNDTLLKSIAIVDSMPTVDAQPVKHGHWHSIMMSEATGWDLSLTGGRDSVCELICSLCKRPAIVDENGEDFLPSFCPNCGAKMDGGDADADS